MPKRLPTKTGISKVWATVKICIEALVALWKTKIADPAAKLPFQIKVAIAVVVFALSLWFVLAPLAPGKQRERKALASAQSVGRPSRSSRSSKSNGNGHEVEKDDTPAPKASKKARSVSPAPRSRSTRRSKK